MGRKPEHIQAVIDNLRRIYQAIGEYSKNAEKTTGLTGPQLWAIKILAHETPLKVSELAARMYLHPATVVGILDRLEAKGLSTRTRSKTDRRAMDVVLTEQGRTVVANAPEVAQTMLVKGFEGMTDDEFTGCAFAMERIAGILGADQATPLPLHD